MNLEELIAIFNQFIERFSKTVADLREAGEIAEAEDRELILSRVQDWLQNPTPGTFPEVKQDYWDEVGLEQPKAPQEQPKEEQPARFTGNYIVDELLVKADDYRSIVLANNQAERYFEVIEDCKLALDTLSREKLTNVEDVRKTFDELLQEANSRLDKAVRDLEQRAFANKDLSLLEKAIRLNPKSEELKKKYQELRDQIQPSGDIKIEIEVLRAQLTDPNIDIEDLEKAVRRAEYLDEKYRHLTDEDFRNSKAKGRSKLNKIHAEDSKVSSVMILGDLKERYETYQKLRTTQDHRLQFTDRNGQIISYEQRLQECRAAWITGSKFATQHNINNAKKYLPDDPMAFTDHLNDFFARNQASLTDDDKAEVKKQINDQSVFTQAEESAKNLIREADREFQPYGQYEKRVKARNTWPGLIKISGYKDLDEVIKRIRPRALQSFLENLEQEKREILASINSIYSDQDLDTIHNRLDEGLNRLTQTFEQANLWIENQGRSSDEFSLPEELVNFQKSINSEKELLRQERDKATRIFNLVGSIESQLENPTPQKVQEANQNLNAMESDLGLDYVKKYAIYRNISLRILSQANYAQVVERLRNTSDHALTRREWEALQKQIRDIINRDDYVGSCAEEIKKEISYIGFRTQIRITIDDCKRRVETYEWQKIRDDINGLRGNTSRYNLPFPELDGVDVKELESKISECEMPAAEAVVRFYQQGLLQCGVAPRLTDTQLRGLISNWTLEKSCDFYNLVKFVATGERGINIPVSLVFSKSFSQAEAYQYWRYTREIIRKRTLTPAIEFYNKNKENQVTSRQLLDEVRRMRDEVGLLEDSGLIETEIEFLTLEWLEVKHAIDLQEGEDRGRWEKIVDYWEKLRKKYPSNRVIKDNYQNALIRKCISLTNTMESTEEKIALVIGTIQNPDVGDSPELIHHLAHIYWKSKNYQDARKWLEKIDTTFKPPQGEISLQITELKAEEIANQYLADGNFIQFITFLRSEMGRPPLDRSIRLVELLKTFSNEKTSELLGIFEQNKNGDASGKLLAFEAVVDLGSMEEALGIVEAEQRSKSLLDSMLAVLPDAIGEVIARRKNFDDTFAQRNLEVDIEEISKIRDRLNAADKVVRWNTEPQGVLPKGIQASMTIVELVNLILKAKGILQIDIPNTVTLDNLRKQLSLATKYRDDLIYIFENLTLSDETDQDGNKLRYRDGLIKPLDDPDPFKSLEEIRSDLSNCSEVMLEHERFKKFKRRLDAYKEIREWGRKKIAFLKQSFITEKFPESLSVIEELKKGLSLDEIDINEHQWILSVLDAHIKCQDPHNPLVEIKGLKAFEEIAKRRVAQRDSLRKRKEFLEFILENIKRYGYSWTLESRLENRFVLRAAEVNQVEDKDFKNTFNSTYLEIERIFNLYEDEARLLRSEPLDSHDYDVEPFTYSSARLDISNKLKLFGIIDLSEPLDIESQDSQAIAQDISGLIARFDLIEKQLQQNLAVIIKFVNEDWLSNNKLMGILKTRNIVYSRNQFRRYFLIGVEMPNDTERALILNRIDDHLIRVQATQNDRSIINTLRGIFHR